MASLTGQSIASSYEQLLHVDADGGGNGTTLVDVKDGDNGTTFALKLAQFHAEVRGTTGTGATGAGKLNLATAELTVVDNDVLGRIDFLAPLESSGTDAILAGASIWGEAEDTFAADNNSTALVFATNTSAAATERMRITHAGNVNIGSAASAIQATGLHVAKGSPGVMGHITIESSSNTTLAPTLHFAKARGSVGSRSAINTAGGDYLGSLAFTGFDGSNDRAGAQIDALSVATSSAGTDMPADLVFSTSADGSSSPSERMRITSAGRVGINVSDPSALLEVKSSASADAAIHIDTTSAGNDAMLFFREAGTTKWVIYNDGDASDTLKIQDDGDVRVTIDQSGDVGIGRVPSTNHSSYLGLELGGDGTIMSHVTAGGGATYYGNGFYYDGSWKFINASGAGTGATNIAMQDNEMVFYAAYSASHSAGDAITFNAVAKLDHNSRISLSNNLDANTSNTVFGKSAWNIASTSTNNASDQNVCIGELAMGTGTIAGASDNVAVGYRGLEDITEGDGNVALGSYAGSSIVDGSSNVAIGGYDGTTNGAMKANVSASQCVAVGTGALAGVITQNGTVAVGHKALTALTSGQYNTAVGHGSLSNNSTGAQNTYLGYDAGFGVSGQSSANNVGIGAFALNLIRTGADNVVVGLNAMADLNSGDNAGASSQNVVIGSHAGGGAWANTQTDGIVAIGYQAMDGALDNVDGTVAIGAQALTAITSGQGNVAVGYQALQGHTTGGGNTAIGHGAMDTTTGSASATSINNVAIGKDAMGGDWNDASTSGHNVAIGAESMDGVLNGADGNVSVGYSTMGILTSGDYNTSVGHVAGDILTTGTSNTIIGAYADPSANSSTNQTVIGRGATGQADNSVTLGNADVTDVYLGNDGRTATGRARDLVIGAQGGGAVDVTTNATNSWIQTGGNISTDNHWYGLNNEGTIAVQNGSSKTATGIQNQMTWSHSTAWGTLNGITNNVTINTVGSSQSGDVNGINTTVTFTDADGDAQNIYGVKTLLDLNDGITSTNVYGTYTEIDIEANHEAEGSVYGSYIKLDDADASAGAAYGLYVESGANIDSAIYTTGDHGSGNYAVHINNTGGDNADRYGMRVSAGANDGSGTTYYMRADDGNGDAIGYLQHATDFTAANASDNRLKQDIVDTDVNGLDVISKIKIRDFKWKKRPDELYTGGIIAQELKESYPHAVYGEDGAMESYEITPKIKGQDAVYYNDEEEIPSGKKVGDLKTEAIEAKDAVMGERISPMTISRDRLVPVLIKAVQELTAKVEALEKK